METKVFINLNNDEMANTNGGVCFGFFEDVLNYIGAYSHQHTSYKYNRNLPYWAFYGVQHT